MLNVARALKNPGQAYPFSETETVSEMDVLGDLIAFSNVEIRGEFFGAGDDISLKATVTAGVTAHCARCLTEVRQPIEAQIDEVFMRVPKDDEYSFAGDEIDLQDAVRDALLLELPMRFLCDEDCKGLCPVCGANRNLGECGCVFPERENPFSILKNH